MVHFVFIFPRLGVIDFSPARNSPPFSKKSFGGVFFPGGRGLGATKCIYMLFGGGAPRNDGGGGGGRVLGLGRRKKLSFFWGGGGGFF